MDSLNRFTTKAVRYDRYRWGYAPESIHHLLDITSLGRQSYVADIGSGTGILTKELVDKVDTIYAVEPNQVMRQIAECHLGQYPAFISVDGKAEATTLPDQSVDLIVVATALHWFEPEPTLQEFRRILKPDGWLAVFFHSKINQDLYQALQTISCEENGWDLTSGRKPIRGDSHTDYYFGEHQMEKVTFPQIRHENWEAFSGGILSDSHAPEDKNPKFPRFMADLRAVFDQFNTNGMIQIMGGTELMIGKISKEV